MVGRLRVAGAALVWVMVLACHDVPIKGAYCKSSLDCTEKPYTTCDTHRNACSIPSAGDMSSGPDGGLGDLNGPMCTAATAATACADPMKPICGTGGSCQACSDSGDDAACLARSAMTPRCLTAGSNEGQCGACVPAATETQSKDCAGALGDDSPTPVCADSGSCRACQSHAECTSGICIFDGLNAGACAGVSAVALVDNGGATTAQCQANRTKRDGTSATTAYCDVSEAVTAKKSYVLVKASTQPYGAIALTDQSITIVGPGKASGTTGIVRLYSPGAASVNVTANSGANSTVLDGLELGGDTVSKSLRGLACTNSSGVVTNASVTVRNCGLHDSSDVGISNNGCTLVADANIIGVWGSGDGGNAGGGVSLVGSNNSTLTNNIIAGNGSLTTQTAGISIGNSSTVTIAFNTIVFNAVMAGVGGIDCGTGTPKTILDSIVYKNTNSGGSQLGAACTLTNVATFLNDDTHGTVNATPPTFVSAFDFHLVAKDKANEACCVDKVVKPGTPNNLHDVDLNTRPRGVSWDIGAHEVE